MDVDTEPKTDDEQMDEDYPVGEGVGEEEGVVMDSDGDEMMGDEIQDDQEYEEAMEDEGMEPMSAEHVESEPVQPPPAVVSGIAPPIPFSPTGTPPVVIPFPEAASASTSGGSFADASSSGLGTTTLASSRPLESPPAPETEMTSASDTQPDSTKEGQSETSLTTEPPLTAEEVEGMKATSQPFQQVATTEEALEVLASNPADKPERSTTEQAMPTSAEAQAVNEVGSSQSEAEGSSGPRETTPRVDSDGHELQVAHETDEEYYDEEEEDEHDYPIDAHSLPPIIVHLPEAGARALFTPYESDPDTLAVWLKDRHEELAEASLADVWAAIRAECDKDGLSKNGALVISEKQMELRMHEDDINLRSITFLELIVLHHDCGLPKPVQLYLTWKDSRFITRFNAIQHEVNAMKEQHSEDEEEGHGLDAVHDIDERVPGNETVQSQPEHVATPSVPIAARAPPAVMPKTTETDEAVGEVEDPEEEEYEEEYDEAYGGEAAAEGLASVDGEQREMTNGVRPRDDDAAAEYAESEAPEITTRDLKRDHPNWAAAMAQPTDALHYEGTATQRHLNYNGQAHRASASPGHEGNSVDIVEADEPADKGAGDAILEREVDDDEEQWDEDAGTVDDYSNNQTEDNEDEGRDDMPSHTVPLPRVLLSDSELQRIRSGKALSPSATPTQDRTPMAGQDDASILAPPDEVESGRSELTVVTGVPAISLTGNTQPSTVDGVTSSNNTSGLTVVPPLTPSEDDNARALAERILTAPTTISEKDEEESVFIIEKRIQDNANREADADTLPVPIGGANGAPLIVDELERSDEGYSSGTGDYNSEDPVSDTLPATPHYSDGNDLKFHPDGGLGPQDEDDEQHEDDEEQYDEVEDGDEGYGSEATLDGQSGETDTGLLEDGADTPTVTVASMPLSAKRRPELDEEDLGSKRPKGDSE
ncbi:hypothetical protein IAU60_002160 [Kwoniella sp. DSM 27419]